MVVMHTMIESTVKCNNLVGLFVCMPCTIILDFTCCIPMTFGCYEINTPGFWMFTL